jgi:type IV secretion system protein VirB5
MTTMFKKCGAAAAVVCGLASPSAHAGIPTVDLVAIASDAISWMTQFGEVAKQIQEAKRQYDQLKLNYEQAKNTADALKGDRGMGLLLNDPSVRQSLDGDFEKQFDKIRAMGSAAATAEAKAVYGAIKSFDCAAQFPTSIDGRKRCEARVMTIPTTVALLNDSIKRSRDRATELQKLIAQVDSAQDMKAAADLQNRIASEVALLNNEQTMMAQAQAQLRAQADLNALASKEAGLKRMVGGGSNPFGN